MHTQTDRQSSAFTPPIFKPHSENMLLGKLLLLLVCLALSGLALSDLREMNMTCNKQQIWLCIYRVFVRGQPSLYLQPLLISSPDLLRPSELVGLGTRLRVSLLRV